MIKTDTLDKIISEYYDEEMNESSLMNYEARIAISKGIRDYTNDICFEYFKISNSIKKVKARSTKNAEAIVESLELKNKQKLFNFNSVFLKRINKRLRRLFLNFKRHDSK